MKQPEGVDFSAFPWYALRVKARSESLAACALRAKNYDPFCPAYLERRRYSDRMKIVETALFPGYLFCRFDLQRKLPVISSTAVQYIVGVGGEPTVLADDLIAGLRRAAEGGAQPVPYLQTGQRVRVLYGPFAGIEGVFVGEAGKNQFIITIDMLQRSIALHLDKSVVCPA